MPFGLLFPSKNGVLSQGAYNRFAELDIGDNVIATYIWVDTYYDDMICGKSKVLDFKPADISQVPKWDCSSPVHSTDPNGPVLEYFLEPVAMYRDPFLRGNNYLVLCETFEADISESKPTVTNQRHSCKNVLNKVTHLHPWFGIEQEYILTDLDNEPLGWPKRGVPRQELGRSNCASGAKWVIGRQVVDSHLRACLYAGLKIGGTVAESVPSQWEFQIGPCEGVKTADEIIVARYLLQRVCEDFGVDFTLDPMPVKEASSHFTTGAHCNFSTEAMRTPGIGMEQMMQALEKLKNRHAEHLKKYDLHNGEDNRRRLSVKDYTEFTSGVGTRETSARIPGRCAEKGCGYIEDRRPAGNADPYVVMEMLVRTICLNE